MSYFLLSPWLMYSQGLAPLQSHPHSLGSVSGLFIADEHGHGHTSPDHISAYHEIVFTVHDKLGSSSLKNWLV